MLDGDEGGEDESQAVAGEDGGEEGGVKCNMKGKREKN
jgi:hypothetical protein